MSSNISGIASLDFTHYFDETKLKNLNIHDYTMSRDLNTQIYKDDVPKEQMSMAYFNTHLIQTLSLRPKTPLDNTYTQTTGKKKQSSDNLILYNIKIDQQVYNIKKYIMNLLKYIENNGIYVILQYINGITGKIIIEMNNIKYDSVIYRIGGEIYIKSFEEFSNELRSMSLNEIYNVDICVYETKSELLQLYINSHLNNNDNCLEKYPLNFYNKNIIIKIGNLLNSLYINYLNNTYYYFDYSCYRPPVYFNNNFILPLKKLYDNFINHITFDISYLFDLMYEQHYIQKKIIIKEINVGNDQDIVSIKPWDYDDIKTILTTEEKDIEARKIIEMKKTYDLNNEYISKLIIKIIEYFQLYKPLQTKLKYLTEKSTTLGPLYNEVIDDYKALIDDQISTIEDLNIINTGKPLLKNERCLQKLIIDINKFIEDNSKYFDFFISNNFDDSNFDDNIISYLESIDLSNHPKSQAIKQTITILNRQIDEIQNSDNIDDYIKYFKSYLIECKNARDFYKKQRTRGGKNLNMKIKFYSFIRKVRLDVNKNKYIIINNNCIYLKDIKGRYSYI